MSTTRPISIQCEATNCLFNTAGECNKIHSIGVVEISQSYNSAVCANYVDKTKCNE